MAIHEETEAEAAGSRAGRRSGRARSVARMRRLLGAFVVALVVVAGVGSVLFVGSGTGSSTRAPVPELQGGPPASEQVLSARPRTGVLSGESVTAEAGGRPSAAESGAAASSSYTPNGPLAFMGR